MKILALIGTAFLLGSMFISIGLAQENKVESIAIEQKLQRLFELHRVGETVSLSKREMRFNLGVAYVVEDDNALGLNISSNSLNLTGTFAYGITDWFEAAMSVPLRWDAARAESPDQRIGDRSLVGLGGLGVRLIAALPTRFFETTAILSISLPTGRKEFEADRLQTVLGLNVAKVMRPAFVFGGLAWLHDWDRGINGIQYTGGVGFFLNHSLSLGFEVEGTRFINPQRGRPFDVVSATTRLTYQATPTFAVAPHISMGLTESAPDVVVGANLLWRF